MASRSSYDNPGPYRHGNRVSFDSGRSYRVTGASRKQAGKYLAAVKRAERRGRPIPRGPHGMTPSEAAIELAYGLRRHGRKRRKPVSGVRTKPRKRPAAPPRPSRTPRARPARSAAGRIPDFWDETARIYGTLR